MKLIGFFFILSCVVACDPWGFGFKKNPAYVLTKAFEASMAEDPESFIQVSGREALCLYGNENGLEYLKLNMGLTDPEAVEIFPKLIQNSTKETRRNPVFVGFWSYYQERYTIDILNKLDKKELLQVIVECHYGMEGEKRPKHQDMKLKHYKKKECRVIKIIPFNFKALPMTEECRALQVNL
jgi:hypothetical protein